LYLYHITKTKENMSRFKPGDIVYMGRGDKLQTLTVKKVIDNPMVLVYQYAFEEVGFACGEQSIRGTIDGPDLKLSECYKNQLPKATSMIVTVANSFGKTFETKVEGVVLFKPDLVMTKWLAEYAKGRLIIDVGCGQGHLVRMLKMKGARAIGFEPELDRSQFLHSKAALGKLNNINEVLDYHIESEIAKGMIDALGERGLLIFARPDDWDIVPALNAMPAGMEALVIVHPKDKFLKGILKTYGAKKLRRKGCSEDGEFIYSIKKV
jgi:SAM-dependent methyltransferase